MTIDKPESCEHKFTQEIIKYQFNVPINGDIFNIGSVKSECKSCGEIIPRKEHRIKCKRRPT